MWPSSTHLYADNMAIVRHLKDELTLSQYYILINPVTCQFKCSFTEPNIGQTKQD